MLAAHMHDFGHIISRELAAFDIPSNKRPIHISEIICGSGASLRDWDLEMRLKQAIDI